MNYAGAVWHQPAYTHYERGTTVEMHIVPTNRVKLIRKADGQPLNPRGPITDTKSLQLSIAATGQIIPALVTPDPENDGWYYLIAGQRRLTALNALWDEAKATLKKMHDSHAGADRVEEAARAVERYGDLLAVVMNVDPADHTSVVKLMLAENGPREDMPWLRMAAALRDLRDNGVPTKEAADIVGISVDRARFVIDLLDEPASVQQAVADGKLDLEGYRAMRAQPADVKAEIAEGANALPEGQKMKRSKVRAEVEKHRNDEPADAPAMSYQPSRAPADDDTLDADVVIGQTQMAVSNMLAILDARREWPVEALPSIQHQLRRLVARLEAEGFIKGKAASVPSDGDRLADDEGDEQGWADEDDEEADEYAPIAEPEQASLFDQSAAEEESEEDEDVAPAQGEPVGTFQIIQTEGTMPYTVKVEGHPELMRRRRNAAGVKQYADELAAMGYVPADSATAAIHAGE